MGKEAGVNGKGMSWFRLQQKSPLSKPLFPHFFGQLKEIGSGENVLIRWGLRFASSSILSSEVTVRAIRQVAIHLGLLCRPRILLG